MLLNGRKQAILNLLREEHTVSVQSLIERFQSAPATIRRDIAALEEEGLLRRTYGEVHWIPDNTIPQASERSALHVASKRAIAQKAAALVGDGMTVLLDSGTTTLALARELKSKTITVVTNSLDIALALSNTGVNLISCGGFLQSSHMCFLGPDAEAFLSRLEVGMLFIGATGIRGTSGITTSSPMQYNIKRRMMDIAKKRYVLLDTSKFHSANLYQFAEFKNLDGVICNRPVPGSFEEKQLRIIEQNGTRVIYAD